MDTIPGYGLPLRRLEALLTARGFAGSGGAPTPPKAGGLSAVGLASSELKVIGAAVLRLQRGFTGERALAGVSYMDEPELLAAYLLYYWPVSYAQASRALSLTGLRPSSVLDLGSGPGPMAAAALDRGATRATLIDKSASALALAERLLAPAALFTSCLELDALVQDGNAGTGISESFDLICFGHSLNEYHAGEDGRIERRLALVERAARQLADGGSVLIIDPATLASARDALALRDALCARGWRVIAPCATDAPCPALAAGPSHSCHDEAAWSMPAFVEGLAAQAGLDRELIKMSWFALRPPAPQDSPRAAALGIQAPAPGSEAEPDPSQVAAPARASGLGTAAEASRGALYRVVSEPMLNKAGRVRRLICGQGGRFPLSAKRGDRYADDAGFFSLKRYDLIRVTSPELREGGWGIDADTRIQVAQSPEPGLV